MHTLRDRKLHMQISSDESGNVLAELLFSSARFSHVLAQKFFPAAHDGWLRFVISMSDSEACRFDVEKINESAKDDLGVPPSFCSYSPPIPGVFLFHCDDDDVATLHTPNCSHVFQHLSDAVRSCNERRTCHGITMAKGRGFELRFSSSRGASPSEISWIKETCSPHLAVTDPRRCSSFFLVDDRFQCMRNGSFQPHRWVAGCHRRELVIPANLARVQEMNFRDHGDILLNMQGCSHDGWILSKDAANGIWLGSLDGKGGNAFHGVMRDFAVTNRFWEGGEKLKLHPWQEKRMEKVRMLANTINLCISEAMSFSLERSEHRERNISECNDACSLYLSSHVILLKYLRNFNFCRKQWRRDVKHWAFGKVRSVLHGLSAWCEHTRRNELAMLSLGINQQAARIARKERKQSPHATDEQVTIRWPLQFSHHFKDDFVKDEAHFALRAGSEDVEIEILFDNLVVGYAERTFSFYNNDVTHQWPLSRLLEFDVIAWVGWHSLEIRMKTIDEKLSRYDVLPDDTNYTRGISHRAPHASLLPRGEPWRPQALCLNARVQELGVDSVVDLGSGSSGWMAPVVTMMLRDDVSQELRPRTRRRWHSVDFVESFFAQGAPAMIEIFDWSFQLADVTDDRQESVAVFLSHLAPALQCSARRSSQWSSSDVCLR
eukprot:757273-Hanusia_phi.AAC.2